MADETIPPALTADEWRARSMSAKGIDDMLNTVYEEESPFAVLRDDSLSFIDGPVGPIVFQDPASFHGLVALANAALPDGDPRRITREDAQDVRDIGVYLGTDAPVRLADRYAAGAAMSRVAAKLAALLPPDDGR